MPTDRIKWSRGPYVAHAWSELYLLLYRQDFDIKDHLMSGLLHNQPVYIVVKDIAIGAEGPGFEFREGQTGHSVVSSSMPQLRFFGAMLPVR